MVDAVIVSVLEKIMSKTPEQQARDLLERLGHPRAQELSAGDVVELANLINNQQITGAQHDAEQSAQTHKPAHHDESAPE